MTINRENYEAYLLDLLEGRLAPHEEEGLRNFLAQNPDIDWSLPEDTSLHPTPIKSFPKESLRFDQLNEATREHFYIANIEGALDKIQQQHLAEFLKSDKRYQKEYTVFERTILNPLHVGYPNKKTLHAIADEVHVLPLFSRWRAIAAVVLLLMGLGYGAMRLLMNDAQQLYAPELRGLDLSIEVHEETRPEVLQLSLEKTKVELVEASPISKTTDITPTSVNKIQPLSDENRDVFTAIAVSLAPKIAASNWQQKKDNSYLVLKDKEHMEDHLNDLAIEEAESNLERITLGDFLVNAFAERAGKNAGKFIEQSDFSAKLSSLFGENNFIDKKDGKRVKTSFSLGKLKIERTHSS
jgi:hypothetical protein